ncbi:hypothetical protein SPI_03526 [Niveomyces insectorum RCEF 264]|uniref:Uncharacterized protein n=1 Tax=Niveomyces insectorum RCEF 264 TaxID=1081102 RepID=A0A167W5G5_9HYPO|nr:hypothetical protein SPI_03526 [Niveomyces insectorum RCEF 264]
MQPQPPPKVRIRGMFLTAGIAGITIVGALFGASLKSKQETKQRLRKATEPGSEDELIASLESRRLALAQTLASWETKAQALQERMERNAQRSIGGATGGDGGRGDQGGDGSGGSTPSGK